MEEICGSQVGKPTQISNWKENRLMNATSLGKALVKFSYNLRDEEDA